MALRHRRNGDDGWPLHVFILHVNTPQLPAHRILDKVTNCDSLVRNIDHRACACRYCQAIMKRVARGVTLNQLHGRRPIVCELARR